MVDIGRIDTWTEDGVRVLGLIGEFDLGNRVQLVELIERFAESGQELIIDLRETEYLDVNAALVIEQKRRTSGGCIELRDAHGEPSRILDLARGD